MVDADTEHLSFTDATAQCLAIHGETKFSKSLLQGLIAEGILLKETIGIGDPSTSPVESIRFTYQRMSDYLRAQVVLTRYPADQALARTIREWSHSPSPWAKSGLIEALAVLAPETRGRELPSILRVGPPKPGERWSAGNARSWLKWQVYESFINSLIWRSPESFTDVTMKLVAECQRAGAVEPEDWLRIVCALAIVPDHPLNALWLDERLSRMELGIRDRDWTRPVLWVWDDGANPISRTIDWAWLGPDATDEVAELAGIFLTWLLTSTGRRLRDTATKALVALMGRKPHLALKLVERFNGVNDPYVFDRLIAAVYGHVLRRRNLPPPALDLAQFTRLGGAIYDSVFAGDVPHHLMIRHRARFCILAIDLTLQNYGTTVDRDLGRINPPYRSPWPLKAPSLRVLASGFGREPSEYLAGATELSWEFTERLERHTFSDLVSPNQGRLRAARRRKLQRTRNAALAELLDATPPSRLMRVRKAAARLIGGGDHGATNMNDLRAQRKADEKFEALLSAAAREAWRVLRQCIHDLDRVSDETISPDPDLCGRWVAGRVLALGWSKELFGDQTHQWDRTGRDRATQTMAEKYTSIAFQELCGVLTDHCQIDERWNGGVQPYLGPWQLTDTLDLDPSVLLRGDVPAEHTSASRLRAARLKAEEAPRWYRTLRDHCLRVGGSDDDWLSDRSDVPEPAALLQATDPNGRAWVAIERHVTWEFKDPTDLSSGYRRIRRQLWFRCESCISNAGGDGLPSWAANTNWMGIDHTSTAQDVWFANLGEYPDIEPWPRELDIGDRERRPSSGHDPGVEVLPWGWEYIGGGGPDIPYALATSGWHQESTVDRSFEDAPGAIVPSRTLLKLLGVSWAADLVSDESLELGPIEREYSWAAEGEIFAFCSAAREYGSGKMLWIRADRLDSALKSAGLVLWTWVLGEKVYWTGTEPSSDRSEYFGALQASPGMPLEWGFTAERTHGRGRGSRGTRERLSARRASGISETSMTTSAR